MSKVIRKSKIDGGESKYLYSNVNIYDGDIGHSLCFLFVFLSWFFFCVFIHLEVQVKSKSIKHMKQTSGGCRSERVASSRCYNSLVIRSELYDRSRLFFSQKGRKVVSLDSHSHVLVSQSKVFWSK